MRRLAALSLLLMGCDRQCPALADVPIRDPDGLLGEAEITEIRNAMVWFGRATGGTEACIQSVDIVDELPRDHVAGRWHPVTRRISIDDDAELRHTTVHELCHAWDDGHGWPSWNDDRLKEPALVGDARGAALADRIELFAEVCDDFLAPDPIAWAAERDCSAPARGAVRTWLHDAVFQGRAGGFAATVPAEVKRWPLAPVLGAFDPQDIVAADDAVWISARRTVPGDIYTFDIALFAFTNDLAPLSERHWDGSESPWLLELVPGRPQPLATVFEDDAWRVRELVPETGALGDAVSPPQHALGWGAERRGDDLFSAWLEGADPTIHRAPLDGGWAPSTPVEPAVPDVDWQWDVAVTDRRVVVGVEDAEETGTLVFVDSADGSWSGVAAGGADLDVLGALDGDRVASMVEMDGGHFTVGAFAADGRTWIPDGCAGVADWSPAMATAGNIVWFLDQRLNESGETSIDLVRVDLELPD